jgi:hypothetical protein
MRRLRSTITDTTIVNLVLLTLLFAFSLPRLQAQDDTQPQPTTREAIASGISEPVSELAKQPQPRATHFNLYEVLPASSDRGSSTSAVDPVEQSSNISAPTTDYAISLDFLGLGNGFPGFTVTSAPPDTNMAVGDTQIVQWVNGSFAVFNKFNGQLQAGPIAGNLLFTSLGVPCATHNDPGPIAQWDNAAHRWLLALNTQTGPAPYYACIAVSTSADATGTYYVYAFSLGNSIPNYQKWGRWINSWTQAFNLVDVVHNLIGPQVCAYERAALINNTGPRQHCFATLHIGPRCLPAGIGCESSLLPADIDSPSAPPSTEDQFLIGSVNGSNNSHLSLYTMHLDWGDLAHALLSGDNNSQLITVPTYSSCHNFQQFPCVPQPGSPPLPNLNSFGDRLMYRFAYFNDPVGGKQHWYVNHDVAAAGGQLGVRWYEFQAPQLAIVWSQLTLFQSGTWSPDSNYRWMGSIAADQNNNILIGYSESSTSVYPSIAVAGRVKSAPLNTLEPEIPIATGGGVQTGLNLWGSYSAMRLDPDGCTFWYTQEYYPTTSAHDWSTRIASVRFANCTNPAYNGYIELCKQSDPNYPVTGTFNFNLSSPFYSSGPYAVPVGTCSGPIQVPSGELTITEAPQVGVAVDNVTAYSYDQLGNYINELDSWTAPNLSAIVTVMPGGVNLETIATFTNYAAPLGTLKLCKIAGTDSLVGQPFTFDVDGVPPVTINAGPPPGGSCQIVGSFQVNRNVNVSERVPSGVSVSNITVNPPNRGGQQTDHSVVVTIGTGITEVDFTDIVSTPPAACSGQSLITIDPVHNIGYVPLFTHSANGDAQIEVVDLTIGAPNPLLKTVPLSGSSRVLASTYNPNNNTMLVEAITGGTGITVYVLNTSSPYNVLYQVPTTLTFNGTIGGAILEDYPHNRAFVGGQLQIGILDASASPPVWNASSVVNVIGTDSLALNVVTGILFVSADGNNQIIDTTQPLPLTPLTFESLHFGPADDGVAFDKATNILLMSEEAVGSADNNWAFNFADLHYDSSLTHMYWTANNHVIPGEGENGVVGDGPGGQAAINCSTHQGVIADESGQNLKLIHLPSAPVPVGTPLNNNGDPCTNPGGGDAASVYTISGTTLPQVVLGGTSHQLFAAGDPNSLTVDPAHNLAYMMGYTFVGFQRPLFLVRMDMSSPVPGSSPVPHGGFSNGCTNTPWVPVSAAIPMP